MSKKITTDIFKQRLLETLGDEYECIGEYINKSTPIKIKHKCGYEFTIVPHALQYSSRVLKNPYACPMCREDRHQKYSVTEIEQMFVDDGHDKNEYTVIEYLSNKKPMKIRHNICGLEFNITLRNYKHSKHLCPNCDSGFANPNFVNQRKSIDELKQCLLEKNPDYELVSKYRTNRHTDLTFKHKICGTEFQAKPYLANKDHQLICPKCIHRSSFEVKIKEILDKYKIQYEEQKTFKDCKSIKVLKFDFYLPKYNTIIEFDGVYHELPIRGNDILVGQQKRDEIKTKYCNSNNIFLIRLTEAKDSKHLERSLVRRLKKNIMIKNDIEGSTTIKSIANKKNVSE